jgi:putative addiction module CopG family antidote
MTVEIPSDLQQIVRDAIETGAYKNDSEVVYAALRLLKERHRRIEELRREIQPALDQLDRGEGIKIEDEEGLRAFFEDVKKRGRERLEAKQVQT